MPGRDLPPLVLKLGGAALERPGLVVARVRSRLREGPVVVVVSARSGVTDSLLRAVERVDGVSLSRSFHRALVRRYRGGGPQVRSLLERVAPLLEVRSRGPAAVRRRREELLALGERLSAHWLSELLRRAGIPADALESDHVGLIVHQARSGARIDLRRSRTRVRATLAMSLAKGSVPVLTGYFGADIEGEVQILGRGSSDYVAAAVAALVGARGLEIVKRGGPLRAADPRLLPRAPVVRQISYRAAETAVGLGWSVVHPLALGPVRGRRIPVRVTEIGRSGRGSVISSQRQTEPPVLLLPIPPKLGQASAAGRFRLIGPRPTELRERLHRSRPPPGLWARLRGGVLELHLPRRAPASRDRRWLARLVADRPPPAPMRSSRRRR
ncbi:MAG TPA: hypothetical protein VGU43_02800 [Thermoplasmata archaeon]|nr:hypothetical protein [Thermoplasmata archaeon]